MKPGQWGLAVPEFMKKLYSSWLVVWNIFFFPHILGIITPTDFHIFQRGLNHQPENCIPELLGKKPNKIKMTRNELLKRGWEELPISSEDMCRT